MARPNWRSRGRTSPSRNGRAPSPCCIAIRSSSSRRRGQIENFGQLKGKTLRYRAAAGEPALPEILRRHSRIDSKAFPTPTSSVGHGTDDLRRPKSKWPWRRIRPSRRAGPKKTRLLATLRSEAAISEERIRSFVLRARAVAEPARPTYRSPTVRRRRRHDHPVTRNLFENRRDRRRRADRQSRQAGQFGQRQRLPIHPGADRRRGNDLDGEARRLALYGPFLLGGLASAVMAALRYLGFLRGRTAKIAG